MNEIGSGCWGSAPSAAACVKILQSTGAGCSRSGPAAGLRIVAVADPDLTAPAGGPRARGAGRSAPTPTGSSPTRPCPHRHRADRRPRAGAHVHPPGARGRQARGHRQQGAPRAPRDGAVRGGAARAASSLGFEAAVAGGIPLIRAVKDGLAANRILSLRHRQRHLQLHPVQDDRRGARLRRGRSRRRRRTATRRRIRRSTSRGSTPPTSCRSSPRSPSGPAVDLKDIYTEGIARAGRRAGRSPTRASSATGSSSWRSRRRPTARSRPACTRR